MDQQSFLDTISHLHWIDNVGLGVAAVFLALGFWRGLWWQVVRLIGLGAAVAVARWIGPIWGESIQGWGELQADVASGIGWFCAFLLTLIAAAFLGMIGNRTIEAMKLSLVNRSLGALTGVATGLLLHCAAVWACSSFASSTWQTVDLPGTKTGDLIEALTEIGSVLPETF